MANLEELVLQIVADTKGLRADMNTALKTVADSSEKMSKAVEGFTENSSGNLSFFQQSMATMTGFLASQAVLGAFNMVKDAAGFLKDQFVAGAQAAIEEENALKRLANSLALSGQYSQSAMAGLQAFTGEMEELTGIGDDVVASNLAVLSSLTKLDAEGLKRAQKAAIDMSVALGMDLNAATNLVAKGIEGNVSMFSRYGIEIEKGATKAETMANVLGKLESSFGGAAAGAAQTFGGSLKNLSNAWGNLTEEFGKVVTQNPVVVAMMNELTKIIQGLTGSTASASQMLKEVFAAALLTITEILGTMAGMLDSVFGRFTDKFAKATDGLAQMHYAGEQAFVKIAESAEAATPVIENQTVAVKALNEAQEEILKSYAHGLADQATALDASYQYENQLRQTQLEIELASLEEHNQNKWDLLTEDIAYQQELMAAKHEKEWVDLETARANQLITETQFRQAQTALAQKQYLESKKIEADKTKLEAAEQQARMQGYMTFLNGIAAFTDSKNKQIAGIAKAAAITKTTIDAYVAIQNALANVPFPANIAAAAGIGAMAFANVAKIAGIGLNQGGTIAGGGANMDTVPASLTKGETVVTRDLTNQLADFLNRQEAGQGQSGGSVTVELVLRDGLIEMIEAKILERQAANISLLNPAVV